jgi:hypothetical protein
MTEDWRAMFSQESLSPYKKRLLSELIESIRRHIRSFDPGTLIGSELNVALHLRDLDGEVWEPWCVPGEPETYNDNAMNRAREIVDDWEAAVCPEGWTNDEFHELRQLIAIAIIDAEARGYARGGVPRETETYEDDDRIINSLFSALENEDTVRAVAISETHKALARVFFRRAVEHLKNRS